MRLRINFFTGVRCAVEMNRKAWYRSHRPFEIHKHLADFAAIATGHPTCYREISVKPRVKQNPAVNFDPQLTVTAILQLGARLDFKCGAVGMGADDAQATLHRVRFTHFNCDDRGVPSLQKITSRRGDIPSFGFLKLLVPMRQQLRLGIGHGVIRGG